MWMALTDVETLWSFKDLLLCIDDEDCAEEDEKSKDDKWFKRDCKCCGRTKPSTLSFNCEKFALISECKFVNQSLTPGKIESILRSTESLTKFRWWLIFFKNSYNSSQPVKHIQCEEKWTQPFNIIVAACCRMTTWRQESKLRKA